MLGLSNCLFTLGLLECWSNYWVPLNITELEVRLDNHLVGQPIGKTLIINSLRAHINSPNPSKALVLSLHGGTGTGKNYAAKHIVESLYRQGYGSQYAKLYVASRDFMHNDEEHLKIYRESIKRTIETATKSCPYSTFVFDEVDKMPIKLLETILFYIDFHTPTHAQPIDFRKTIFIFLSNSGAKEINLIALRNYFASLPREKYDIVELQRALANASYWENGGLWHASLIEKHLVTFFVPFLPLERPHVQACAEKEFGRIYDPQNYVYKISKKDIILRVLDLLEFTPSDSLIYSSSGCKKVQQKLDFVLEDVRTPVRKTTQEL